MQTVTQISRHRQIDRRTDRQTNIRSSKIRGSSKSKEKRANKRKIIMLTEEEKRT